MTEITDDSLKRCTYCKDDKPLSQFRHYFCKSRNKIRISSRCVTCVVAIRKQNHRHNYDKYKGNRKRYDENYKSQPDKKEKLRLQSKKYREELTDSYLAVYANKLYGIEVNEAKEDKALINFLRAKLLLKRKIRSLKNEK